MAEARRHHRREGDRGQHLACHQPGGKISSDQRLGQPALGQRGAKRVLVETAIGAAEVAHLAELAVDQSLARTHPVLAREFGDGGALQQLVEHPLEPTLRDENLHRQRRIGLPHLLEHISRVGGQFGGVDALIAHDRDPVTAGDAAEGAGVGDVRAGESDRDHHQEGEREANAELRLEEVAEQLEHEGTGLAESVSGAPDADFSGPGAFDRRFIPHAALPQQSRVQSWCAGNCSFDIACSPH